jgi:hypothetical protein
LAKAALGLAPGPRFGDLGPFLAVHFERDL